MDHVEKSLDFELFKSTMPKRKKSDSSYLQFLHQKEKVNSIVKKGLNPQWMDKTQVRPTSKQCDAIEQIWQQWKKG